MDKKREKRIRKIKIVLLVLAIYFAVVSAVLVVVDSRHLEIELLGDENVTVEYGTEYPEAGARAYTVGRIFGEAGKPVEVFCKGSVDENTLGSYELEYTASLRGHDVRVVRTVSVVDTTPPVIELVQDESMQISWFTGYEEEGYSAYDICDGDLTDRVQVEQTGDRYVYTVSDLSGNTARTERMLASAAAPVITLTGGENLQISASLGFTDPGFQALDGLGNDLSDHVTVTGSVCPYKAGTYELTYAIDNGRGDTVSCVRTVSVVPVAKPDIVQPSEKTIYLTFDDGPGPYTNRLLDILAEYGVKATFFVTGTDDRYTDLIGREYAEGHSVGVHTMSHNYYTIYAGEEAFFKDFMAVENMIYEQTGSYTRLCRFPGGSSNTVSSFNPGIMSRLASALNDMGYKYFDWNVYSGDAGETTRANVVVDNITGGIYGKDYAVILQHDIKDFSVEAVEDVIIWGLNNGYTFKGLDMTSPETHHAIAN